MRNMNARLAAVCFQTRSAVVPGGCYGGVVVFVICSLGGVDGSERTLFVRRASPCPYYQRMPARRMRRLTCNPLSSVTRASCCRRLPLS